MTGRLLEELEAIVRCRPCHNRRGAGLPQPPPLITDESAMIPVPDDLVQAPPFDRLYGLELLECSADVARARVAVAERIMQPLGLVHGGVYAAIAETLASLGTNHGVAERGMVALGVANETNFLRAIGEGHVRASARPRHRDSERWVWEVDFHDDDGRLCALSRVTVAVRPHSPPIA